MLWEVVLCDDHDDDDGDDVDDVILIRSKVYLIYFQIHNIIQ